MQPLAAFLSLDQHVMAGYLENLYCTIGTAEENNILAIASDNRVEFRPGVAFTACQVTARVTTRIPITPAEVMFLCRCQKWVRATQMRLPILGRQIREATGQ
jgi:hypothetical protein